jgi:hypothetical protein
LFVAARRTTADPETASAIDALIRARSEGLYALGAKVRELGAARQAVTAAQEAERALHAEALDLQQQTIAAGWTAEELRQAGLYVGAPVVRRRRSTMPAPAPEVDSPAAEPTGPTAATGDGTGGSDLRDGSPN